MCVFVCVHACVRMYVHACMRVRACVRVCVFVREREREREEGGGKLTIQYSSVPSFRTSEFKKRRVFILHLRKRILWRIFLSDVEHSGKRGKQTFEYVCVDSSVGEHQLRAQKEATSEADHVTATGLVFSASKET